MSEPQAAAVAHRKLAESASVMKESAVEQVDSADRRTELAADRTLLAAERTYAAWVRTGLAALAAGVGAKALLANTVATWLATLAGATLVAFSAFCFVAAVWRELRPQIDRPKPKARRLPVGLLLLWNGVLTVIALAAFYGVVTIR